MTASHLETTLTEREKTILTLHHGLHGYGKKNLKQIADLMEISPSRVSQIEKKALRKIGWKSLNKWVSIPRQIQTLNHDTDKIIEATK